MIIYIVAKDKFKFNWPFPNTIGKISDMETIVHCVIFLFGRHHTMKMEYGRQISSGLWILYHNMFKIRQTMELRFL